MCIKNDSVAYTNHVKQVNTLSMAVLKRWMECLADFHHAVCCVSALWQVISYWMLASNDKNLDSDYTLPLFCTLLA